MNGDLELLPTAATPAPTLNEVYSIKQTANAGVFLVSCNVTDASGVTFDAVHGYRESDLYGLSPMISEWISRHPDFPIASYVPPTDEDRRRSMQSLTARQFRLGLLNAGISPSTVTATIAAMPAGVDRDKAQIEWEFATTFNRMHPLIATVGAALALTDTQIDGMWLAAANL